MIHYVEELAHFAANIASTSRIIPDDVRSRAKYIILDSIGVMIAGQRLAEVRTLAAALRKDDELLAQLFVWGTAGVSLELDEGCAATRGHAGIHVVPAAIAAASRAGASGEQLLRAVIAGYEVAARLGAATTFRQGMHPHGTWGGAGGAVAVGVLEGLDTAGLAQAIRIAASLSVATHYETVHEGASARNLWTGMGNVVSLLAARAASSGFIGSESAPAHVFGRTLGTLFDEKVAAAGLGQDWYMLRNYFKLYACCRHVHASVDAFRAVIDGTDVTQDDILSVSVATYGRAVEAVGRSDAPATALAAKFSIPYCLAAYVETGALEPGAFEAPLLGSDRISAFARRVDVKEDPAHSALVPGSRPARVTVRFKNGSERTEEVSGSIGDPPRPLTGAQIEAKALMLIREQLGKEAEAFISSILDLDSMDNVAFIVASLKI